MFLTKEEAKDYESATSRFLRHYECLSKLSAGSTERIGQPLGGLNVGSFLLMRCQPLHLLMIWLASWCAAHISGISGAKSQSHYQEHISEDSAFLNPARVWCYPGEHLVGNATRLANACLAGLPPWHVSTTVCLKYQVGKHIQFMMMLWGLAEGLHKIQLWGPAEGLHTRTALRKRIDKKSILQHRKYWKLLFNLIDFDIDIFYWFRLGLQYGYIDFFLLYWYWCFNWIFSIKDSQGILVFTSAKLLEGSDLTTKVPLSAISQAC